MFSENPYASTGTTEEYHQPRDPWRLPSLAALTLLLCTPIISPPLLPTALAMAAMNAVAALVFTIVRQELLVALAALSCISWVATLLFTEWGFSSPRPIIHLYWPAFVPAVVLLVGWVGWPLWKIPSRQLAQWKAP